MKRLYFRRNGAHCCCASPITRISSNPKGEMRAFDVPVAWTSDPEDAVWTAVEDEKALLATSRGSYTRMRELIQEKGRWN